MKLRPILLVLMLCGLLAAIFLFSNQDATKSSAISNTIAATVLKGVNMFSNEPLTQGEVNRWTRKFAHFFLYFLVAIVMMLICRHRRCSKIRSVITTILCGLLYAMADEYHQLFVDGRGASWRDVGIDGIGILLGVIITLLFKRKWKK